MSADDRIEELLGLAVLGELTTEQEAELDAALHADAARAADLDADLAVAASLQAMHAEAPPADLKAQIMAEIDAHEPSGAATNDVVELASGRADRDDRGVSTRKLSWQPLAVAAAVVMLAVGGIVVATRGGDDELTVNAVAEAEDGQLRTLEGDLGGQLEVVFSPSRQALVVVGADIPVLNDAETYQLWLVNDVGAQSVGLFRPDGSGRVEALFEDLDPTDFVVGVTVEPAAGSAAPTLPIVAAA